MVLQVIAYAALILIIGYFLFHWTILAYTHRLLVQHPELKQNRNDSWATTFPLPVALFIFMLQALWKWAKEPGLNQ